MLTSEFDSVFVRLSCPSSKILELTLIKSANRRQDIIVRGNQIENMTAFGLKMAKLFVADGHSLFDFPISIAAKLFSITRKSRFF